MDISYHGANAITISTKQGTLAIDTGLADLGLKDVTPKEATYIVTQPTFKPKTAEGMVVDGPGEYEIKDISISGVAAARHIDHDDSLQATMYRVTAGDVRIAIVGHVNSPLSEEQLEELGVVDIAVVPVGGSGYTLNAHQAVAVVKQLDPKVVIPTHYDDKAIKYEVPQMELEPFIKEMSAGHEVTPKLKIKNGALPETLTVIEIERS